MIRILFLTLTMSAHPGKLPVVQAEDAETACIPMGSATVCQNDIWPRSGFVTIPDITMSVFVRKVTLYEKDLFPIPALTKLRTLHLRSIVAKDSQEQVVRFPFKQFTSLSTISADYTSASELELIDLDLREIRANDFGGALFVKLAHLLIESCRLTVIDPRSFYPAEVDLLPKNILLRLTVVNADGLKTFPWEALRPISDTMERLKLEANLDMESVDYQPGPASPAMSFKHLFEVQFESNKMLSAIPQSVVNTFIDAKLPIGIPADAKHLAVFKDNANKCDTPSCDIVPLVHWVRRADGLQARSLEASCVKTDNTMLTYPNTQAFWTAFVVPAECPAAPLRPTPTTAPTLAPVTNRPTNPPPIGGGQSSTVGSTGTVNRPLLTSANFWTFCGLILATCLARVSGYKYN